MLYDNVVFWQCLVFVVWGYLTAWMVHVLFAYPLRFIETA